MRSALASVVTMLLVGISASGREPQHFPQEVLWTGRPAEVTQRARLQATMFPEFVFAGTLEEAISHLMSEFRKFSPDRMAVGSFVLQGTEKTSGERLNVRLRGRNTLEIIDNLCALTRCNWTLSPYSILIYRP